jgi:hypothetical protein
MVRVNPQRHALGHPDQSALFGCCEETSVNAFCLLKIGASVGRQYLGIHLLRESTKEVALGELPFPIPASR